MTTAAHYLNLDTPVPPASDSLSESVSAFGMPASRVVATMFADGKSPQEIAKALGKSEDKIRAILRLPETQKVLAELVVELGDSVVANVLKATRLDTVLRLVQLRDGGATDTVRLAACKELLDRAEGKAVARERAADDSSRLPTDPKARMEFLNSEINRLQSDKT